MTPFLLLGPALCLTVSKDLGRHRRSFVTRCGKGSPRSKDDASVCFGTAVITFFNRLDDANNVQWSNTVINACPPALTTTLAPQLNLIQQALAEFSTCYKAPMAPLVPRPAIILAGALTSSLTLLEQAIWSAVQKEPSAALDAEVFRRWVAEGDLVSSLDAVRRANQAGQGRIGLNMQLVYGLESGSVKGKL